LSSATDDEVVDSCSWFYGDIDIIFENIPTEYGITKEMFDNAKENIK